MTQDNSALGIFFDSVMPEMKSKGTGELKLHQCSLHTEQPSTAAHAPTQVKAAVKRGATVVGFTELVSGKVNLSDISAICKDHNYHLLHGGMDIGLAFNKSQIAILNWGVIPTTATRGFVWLRATWEKNEIMVIEQHWLTDHPTSEPARQKESELLARKMKEEAKGNHLAFFMGDTNSDFRPHVKNQIRDYLKSEGIESIQERLDQYPITNGGRACDIIGNYIHDGRVKPEKLVTFGSLGSDHVPIMATYSVKENHA